MDMRARICAVFATVVDFFNTEMAGRAQGHVGQHHGSVHTEFYVKPNPEAAAFEMEGQKFVFTGMLDYLVAVLSENVPPGLDGVDELFSAGMVRFIVGEAKSIKKNGGFEGLPQTITESITLHAQWMEIERQKAAAAKQPPPKLPT